jgi:hypothetical protein
MLSAACAANDSHRLSVPLAMSLNTLNAIATLMFRLFNRDFNPACYIFCLRAAQNLGGFFRAGH